MSPKILKTDEILRDAQERVDRLAKMIMAVAEKRKELSREVSERKKP